MNEFEELKTKYAGHSTDELIALIAKLQGENSYLKFCLFSSRKERFKDDPQGMTCMFDEVESLLIESAVDTTSDETIEVKAHKKSRGKRKPLPMNLRRVRKEFDLDEAQKFCSLHQVPLEKFGESITEKLEIVPASSHIIEEVVFKYKCPCCSEDKMEVFKAEKSPDLIPKSFATPSLLSYIAVAKYEDALPLYRQEKIFDRYKIDLGRTTMARWMVKAAKACQPLINMMQEDLLESPVLHCDETPVQVLNEPHRQAEQKSYMWCLARQGRDPIILFRYFTSRSKKAASELLLGFKGVLVCDGYKVYESFDKDGIINVAGCMAHCRRKFWHAEKAANKSSSRQVKAIASTALAFIRKLYALEASVKGQEFTQVLKMRQEKSVPILEQFHEWLNKQLTIVLPKSPTGKAISYALNQWHKLIYFASDGAVPIDNNYLEDHIRPFVLGRKNWLFSASVDGADASSTLYSLIETAKANGIQPFDYLKLIFKELPKATEAHDYFKLLPHQVKRHFALAPYQVPK